MARMGYDSEHGAINYQREARGTDQVITSAIDEYIEPAKGRRANQDGGVPEAQPRNANARGDQQGARG